MGGWFVEKFDELFPNGFKCVGVIDARDGFHMNLNIRFWCLGGLFIWGGRLAANLIASLILSLKVEVFLNAWNHVSMWTCTLMQDFRVSGLLI